MCVSTSSRRPQRWTLDGSGSRRGKCEVVRPVDGVAALMGSEQRTRSGGSEGSMVQR
ncbi:hypothetical protein M6B38_313310 [Iris pallida]|uniref:Uncharacterized protein n=1 Tax=Iris pallida TaxID=29817 RepID=A0AAX6HF84_IRIPA|nr:hypothetical protein M6B38_313310 [Iris pallida]